MNKFFPALLAILLIAGCAVFSDHYKGRSAMGKGNYDEAIFLFEKALKTSPNDPGILTDLGIAYYKKDDLEKASGYFGRAKSLDPTYSKAYLYQGMIYEKQDDIPKAISEYNEFYQANWMTFAGQKLKARIGILMRKQIAKEVKAAIEREKSLDVDSIPENTIAVSYFANLTGNEEYDVLRKGLADMIITDLSQVSDLKVLERTRIQALIDELNLAESGVIDKSTAPRAGRLLGARRLVNGGLALPQDMFRMDALATDVVTDKTDARADVMGEQERFFLMEKELVLDILHDLNVKPSQEELDAIQKLPTESFLAFLAYSRGLDYEDRGMYREAAQECHKAAELDPDFSLAAEKCQINQILASDPIVGDISELGVLEIMVVTQEEPPTPDDIVLSNNMRQEVIEQNVGDGFLPSPDEGEQEDDRTPAQQQTRTTVIVTVDLE